MSADGIDVVVDSSAGSVWLGLHKLSAEEAEVAGVTHTMEKHGILLHWNGHGTLSGIEVIAEGRPIHITETMTTINGKRPDNGQEAAEA